jgi:DNA-binding XRE family transcriptional regulator
MLLNIHLAELREHMQKTQTDVAQILDIKQPTVAGIEKTRPRFENIFP